MKSLALNSRALALPGQSVRRETRDVQWPDLMRDYFRLDLDEDLFDEGADPASVRWWNEIKEVMPDITNGQICNAIRWASDGANVHRSEKMGKPTVAELMRWIRSCKKAPESVGDQVDCKVCGNKGWVTHYEDWTREWKLEDYGLNPGVQVPCLCGYGQLIVRTTRTYTGCDEYGLNKLKADAGMAHDSYKHMEKLLEAKYGKTDEQQNKQTPRVPAFRSA